MRCVRFHTFLPNFMWTLENWDYNFLSKTADFFTFTQTPWSKLMYQDTCGLFDNRFFFKAGL